MDNIILSLDDEGRREVLKIYGYSPCVINKYIGDFSYLSKVKEMKPDNKTTIYNLNKSLNKWKQIMDIYNQNGIELTTYNEYQKYVDYIEEYCKNNADSPDYVCCGNKSYKCKNLKYDPCLRLIVLLGLAFVLGLITLITFLVDTNNKRFIYDDILMSSIDNYEFINIKRELIKFGCYKIYPKNITIGQEDDDIYIICEKICNFINFLVGGLSFDDYNRLYYICTAVPSSPINNLTKNIFYYDNIFRLPPYNKLIFMDDFNLYFDEGYILTNVTFYDKECYISNKIRSDESLKYFYIIMIGFIIVSILFSIWEIIYYYTPHHYCL